MKPEHLRREREARELSANALSIALRAVVRPHQRHPERQARRLFGDGDAPLAGYFGNSAGFWLNLQTTYTGSSPRRSSASASPRK